MSEAQILERDKTTGKTGVFLIDPNMLPQIWHDVEPQIARACSYSQGQHNVKSVVDNVLSGNYVLIGFNDGDKLSSVAVMTISQFQTGLRVCELLLASGEKLKDWTDHEDVIADYARQYGCSSIRMIGRHGLQKMLPDWRRTAVVLEKAL